jgi:hypothetical protein
MPICYVNRSFLATAVSQSLTVVHNPGWFFLLTFCAVPQFEFPHYLVICRLTLVLATEDDIAKDRSVKVTFAFAAFGTRISSAQI